MPGDNSATVGGGTAVQFPQDGPASGGITRVPTEGATGSNFILPNSDAIRIGTSQLF